MRINFKVLLLFSIFIYDSNANRTRRTTTRRTTTTTLPPKDNSCRIPFERDQLPENVPFIAKNTDKIYADVQNGKRVVIIKDGDKFQAGCSGSENKFKQINQQQLTIECHKEDLQGPLGSTNFTELGCTNPQEEKTNLILHDSPLCNKGHAQFGIEFEAICDQNELISLCHDDSIGNTLMVKHKIHGDKLQGAVISNKRPAFKVGPFYNKIGINYAYARTSQRNFITELVKNSTLGEEYIQTKTEIYLAKGHLAPDGDMIQLYEQDATYYYANAFPQWQSINNGNWKRLEFALRDGGKKTRSKFDIYTGTQGILKLKDTNGNLTDIYLAKDKEGHLRLPVPNLSWKAIINEKSKKAIVIFMVNNPHQKEKDISRDVICKDVCKSLPWVNWNTKDIKTGFTYCCEITKGLVDQISYIPRIYDHAILNNFD